jgi:hypothetical protein
MDEPMDETSYETVPPRRRSGCLKGCLIVLLGLVLLTGAGIGLIAWKLYSEFRADPRLQAVVMAAERDGRARDELGRHFAVMQVDRRFFPAKGGKAEDFRLVLIGPNGERVLTARLEPAHGGMKIVSMTLTAPDGRSIVLRTAGR